MKTMKIVYLKTMMKLTRSFLSIYEKTNSTARIAQITV